MLQWEYRTIDLPRTTHRVQAWDIASLHGSISGWELLRHRIWPDGRRRMVLRRPAQRLVNPTESVQPGLLE